MCIRDRLCGIAIYFEGKGFITKWDGAEDSDIEPIKGGLSDSMKRAAYQWGIGRVLYSLDTVWVDIERRGRSYIIKASERKKLDDAYLNALKKLGLEPAAASGIQSLLMPCLLYTSFRCDLLHFKGQPVDHSQVQYDIFLYCVHHRLEVRAVLWFGTSSFFRRYLME